MKKINSIFFIFLIATSGFINILTILPENVNAETTFYVGGTGPRNYTFIQAAIDEVRSGDTVFVYAGTYYENIVLTKTITLIGESRDTTIIDGSESWDDVVSITSNNVNITGFTIANGHSDGIDVRSEDVTIIGNNISTNGWDGISLRFSKNIIIKDNNSNPGVLLISS